MSSMSRNAPYRLDDQIGFILRQANQRYAALFANGIGNGLTPTQWAALVRLGETGPCPQNQLGRLTAMDAATIKGVVERLDKRGLIQRSADPDDGRRLLVSLSPAGRAELGPAWRPPARSTGRPWPPLPARTGNPARVARSPDLRPLRSILLSALRRPELRLSS